MNSRLNTKCLRNFHFFVLFPFNFLMLFFVNVYRIIYIINAILLTVTAMLKQFSISTINYHRMQKFWGNNKTNLKS